MHTRHAKQALAITGSSDPAVVAHSRFSRGSRSLPRWGRRATAGRFASLAIQPGLCDRLSKPESCWICGATKMRLRDAEGRHQRSRLGRRSADCRPESARRRSAPAPGKTARSGSTSSRRAPAHFRERARAHRTRRALPQHGSRRGADRAVRPDSDRADTGRIRAGGAHVDGVRQSASSRPRSGTGPAPGDPSRPETAAVHE